MIRSKILFGVCGIGRGHIYRQLPIILHFAKSHKIVIFAFSESLDFFQEYFKNKENIKVCKVAVPWIHGSEEGINYSKTANENLNKLNFTQINFAAMAEVESFLGRPDLVVSDYEPISAMYAYATNCRLITVDQQSKYFYEGYPDSISELCAKEERARLGMFFPVADLRIVCSFFRPPSKTLIDKKYKSKVVSPVIRSEIQELKEKKIKESKHILVYLSAYSEFVQEPALVKSILSEFTQYTFELFVSRKSMFNWQSIRAQNIVINYHGSESYLDVLGSSEASICTAGHTFISEMLYLCKPVYAIPLATYEQNYNAYVVNKNKFGVSATELKSETLKDFINRIPEFKRNIRSDKHILLNKGNGLKIITDSITKYLPN